MDFSELVNNRYSVRNYSDKKVENEKLLQILESACKAPSAVNFQPYKIFVIQSDEKLKAIKECYQRTWFANAPLVIAVIGLHENAWKRSEDAKDHTDIDAAILIDHLTLQAADLGIGTCWVCNFNVSKARETLQLLPDEDVIALIPLGYPKDDEIPEKNRKSINELVKWL